MFRLYMAHLKSRYGYLTTQVDVRTSVNIYQISLKYNIKIISLLFISKKYNLRDTLFVYYYHVNIGNNFTGPGKFYKQM